jgi:hypothetical protein
VFDPALWTHAHDPNADGADFRHRLQELQSAVVGTERESLGRYLETRS